MDAPAYTNPEGVVAGESAPQTARAQTQLRLRWLEDFLTGLQTAMTTYNNANQEEADDEEMDASG